MISFIGVTIIFCSGAFCAGAPAPIEPSMPGWAPPAPESAPPPPFGKPKGGPYPVPGVEPIFWL